MSHSVHAHLAVDPAEYDRDIRRLVPHYDALTSELIAALQRHVGTRPVDVLDVGAGNGALAELVLRSVASARVTVLDIDPDMLNQAKVRLRAFEGRVSFMHGSFLDPLPPCDVAVASLSLHHVHGTSMKRDLYKNIRKAMRAEGLLLNGDASVPQAGKLNASIMAGWAQHLVKGGDSEPEAYARFKAWAEEDRYVSLLDELAMIGEAGFSEADVLWRQGPMSVLIALP